MNTLRLKYHSKNKCNNLHLEINRKGYYEQEYALLFGNLYNNSKIVSKNFKAWFNNAKKKQ